MSIDTAALPDDDEVDHGGRQAFFVEATRAPVPDPRTVGGNPLRSAAGVDKLPAVEAKLRLEFARAVYNKANRKPEGTFNGDTGKWEPTVREDLGVSPPRPAAPAKFKGWAHTYYLCMRACEGHDVPDDIAKFRDELWPKMHEKHFTEAVDAAQKAESAKHAKQQRAAAKRAKLLADAAVADSRAVRIQRALGAIDSYDAKITEHREEIAAIEYKIKALNTRKKRATRSLRALRRFEEKEGKST